MKRLAMVLLLVSVGLNVGLLIKLRGAPPAPDDRGRTEWSGAMRPAFNDTAGWREMFRRRLDRMAERLELTPEQRRSFEEIQQRAGGVMRERRRLFTAAQQHVRELAADGSVDPAAFRQAMLDVRARQAAMDSLAGEFMLQELEILRPDQRARYLELLPLDHGPGHGRAPWRPRGRRGGRHANNPG